MANTISDSPASAAAAAGIMTLIGDLDLAGFATRGISPPVSGVKHLLGVLEARSSQLGTGLDTIGVQLNGLTTAVYTQNGALGTYIPAGNAPQASCPAGYHGSVSFLIPDYLTAARAPTVLSLQGGAASTISVFSGAAAGTLNAQTAVNLVSVILGSGSQFASGRFTLYGLG